jgi:hypothetical protein
MNLNSLKLRSDEPRPAWGAIFWWIPTGYLFVGPYQRHAGWLEWTLTSLAFLAGSTLYVLALIAGEHEYNVRLASKYPNKAHP